MKGLLSYLLLCCKGDTEKGKEVKLIKEFEEVEVVYKNPRPKLNSSIDEPDKDRIPESDITNLNIKTHLKVSRPSIILSMDDSQKQVVLFESCVKNKMKKPRHKKDIKD